ncbi:hypothetical protein JCM5353_000374 [Sporobolomyces roseus]
MAQRDLHSSQRAGFNFRKLHHLNFPSEQEASPSPPPRERKLPKCYSLDTLPILETAQAIWRSIGNGDVYFQLLDVPDDWFEAWKNETWSRLSQELRNVSDDSTVDDSMAAITAMCFYLRLQGKRVFDREINNREDFCSQFISGFRRDNRLSRSVEATVEVLMKAIEPWKLLLINIRKALKALDEAIIHGWGFGRPRDLRESHVHLQALEMWTRLAVSNLQQRGHRVEYAEALSLFKQTPESVRLQMNKLLPQRLKVRYPGCPVDISPIWTPQQRQSQPGPYHLIRANPASSYAHLRMEQSPNSEESLGHQKLSQRQRVHYGFE